MSFPVMNFPVMKFSVVKTKPALTVLLLILGVAGGAPSAQAATRTLPEPPLESLQEARSLLERADKLGQQGRYAEAISLAERALEQQQTVFGEVHLDVLQSLVILADLYRVNKQYSRAEALFQRALPLGRRIWGEETPSVARILFNFGVMYLEAGDIDQAEPLLLDALNMRRQVMPDRYPEMIASLHAMGALHATKGDYPEAEILLKEAVEILEEHLTPTAYSDIKSLRTLLNQVRRFRRRPFGSSIALLAQGLKTPINGITG